MQHKTKLDLNTLKRMRLLFTIVIRYLTKHISNNPISHTFHRIINQLEAQALGSKRNRE